MDNRADLDCDEEGYTEQQILEHVSRISQHEESVLQERQYHYGNGNSSAWDSSTAFINPPQSYAASVVALFPDAYFDQTQ